MELIRQRMKLNAKTMPDVRKASPTVVALRKSLTIESVNEATRSGYALMVAPSFSDGSISYCLLSMSSSIVETLPIASLAKASRSSRERSATSTPLVPFTDSKIDASLVGSTGVSMLMSGDGAMPAFIWAIASLSTRVEWPLIAPVDSFTLIWLVRTMTIKTMLPIARAMRSGITTVSESRIFFRFLIVIVELLMTLLFQYEL